MIVVAQHKKQKARRNYRIVNAPSGGPKPTGQSKTDLSVFCMRRDSKDERHRATLRWSVVTASDQTPAGARIESLRARKSTSSEVLFQ